MTSAERTSSRRSGSGRMSEYERIEMDDYRPVPFSVFF